MELLDQLRRLLVGSSQRDAQTLQQVVAELVVAPTASERFLMLCHRMRLRTGARAVRLSVLGLDGRFTEVAMDRSDVDAGRANVAPTVPDGLVWPLCADDALLGVLVLEPAEQKLWKANPALQLLSALCVLLLGGQQEHHELTRLRSRVRDLEQSALIARLAGGVAHDMNNALTVIMGNAEYLERYLPEAADVGEAQRQLMLAVEHASSLARNLLTLGQQGVEQISLIAVDEVIRRSEALLRSYLGRHTTLELSLGARGWGVDIDPSQFEQCLVNLIINARDAITSSGEVSITTFIQRAEPGNPLKIAFGRPLLRVEVQDSGEGIAPELLDRIKEPFVSDKNQDHHAGLGLATVDVVLRRFGGHFDLQRGPLGGALVRLWLPARPLPSAEPPVETSDVPADWQGVKVLVADDHKAIRDLIGGIFREYGAFVIEADSGEQALSLAVGQDDIDLLVSDVRMPGIDGPTLARRLRQQIPHLRAMFISGYAEARVLGEYLETSQDLFLSKPFSREQLMTLAYEALRR